MGRRIIQLLALALAVALAAGAGTLVRRHLDGPDPVATVEAATRAYASGDCSALKDVSDRPASVSCDDVTGVRDAYRSEGLDPDTFTYDVIARSEDTATVRISYRRGQQPGEEIVQLVKQGDEWKILPTPAIVG